MQEFLDRVPGLRQHAPVDRKTRTLQCEDEAVRHLRRPFAIGRRALRAVESAVDLDRREVLGCVGQLLRMRQPLGVKYAAPGLIGPAADAGINTALFDCHAILLTLCNLIAGSDLCRNPVSDRAAMVFRGLCLKRVHVKRRRVRAGTPLDGQPPQSLMLKGFPMRSSPAGRHRGCNPRRVPVVGGCPVAHPRRRPHLQSCARASGW